MRRPHTSPVTTKAEATSKAAAQTGRVAYSSPGWGRRLLTHVACLVVERRRRLRGVRLVSLPTVDTVYGLLLPLLRSESAFWFHNELFVGSALVSAVADTFDVACASPPFDDLSRGDIWLTPSNDEDGYDLSPDDTYFFPSKQSGDGGLQERPVPMGDTHGGVVPGKKYRDNGPSPILIRVSSSPGVEAWLDAFSSLPFADAWPDARAPPAFGSLTPSVKRRIGNLSAPLPPSMSPSPALLSLWQRSRRSGAPSVVVATCNMKEDCL